MLHFQADAAVNSVIQTGTENIQVLIVICQLKEHVFGLNRNNDLKLKKYLMYLKYENITSI